MKTTLKTIMGMIFITLASSHISQAQPTTLDPGFGNGGFLKSSIANNPYETWGIVEMSGGYYLGVGYIRPSSTSASATLMKYNICGEPDSAFGTNGVSIISIPNRRLTPVSAQELPDGKILLAGPSDANSAPSTVRPTLFRLMQDGSLDLSYGTNGLHLAQPSGVSSGNFGQILKISGDFNIIPIGTVPNSTGGSLGVGLMRTFPDGTPDETFGTGGIRMHSHPDMGYSIGLWEQVHLLNDTYFVTRAESPDGGTTYRVAIYAFDLDGNILTTFGTDGRVQHPTTLRFIGERGIHSTIDSSGRIVIATSVNTSGSGGAKNMIFTRYLNDGTLDTTFGNNGTTTILNSITHPSGVFSVESRTLKTDADGSIIASYILFLGSNLSRSFFIRLDNDGIPFPEGQITFPQFNIVITELIQIDEDRWLAQAYRRDVIRDQSQLRLSTNPIVLPSIEETGSTLSTTGSGPDFQWFLDGEIIPDATEAIFTPSVTGVYTVQMTDELGCQHISNAFELSELSIAENQTARLKLLKNPVEEQIMLQNDLGEMKFEIYNLLGQRVSSGLLINGFNTINVLGLNQGIYLLRTVNADLSHTKRFMKL